jgi:hypothetical protein
LAIIVGCGSGGDLLDEVGQRYTATLEIEDFAGLDLAIDIAQDDCDANATTTDDFEEYGPAIANIDISVSSDAPGITLQSYSIQYIQLPSEDGTGTIVTPPDLDDPLPGFYNIDIPSGGSATFPLTCMSVDTKEEYRLKLGWTEFNDGNLRFWVSPGLDEGRYTIRFTFTFMNTEGHTETIVRDATVWLGDFDNC